MSRIDGGSPREFYPEDVPATQTAQTTSNNEQGGAPVLRSFEKLTGRDDDSDTDLEELSSDAGEKIQHSEPEVKSRVSPNQLPLELEPIDRERFVYTKAHFYKALEDNNAKDLVRMMRFGRCDTDWSEHEVNAVIGQLIVKNQPQLLAELIRESGKFSVSFVNQCQGVFFRMNQSEFPSFIKAMNDHRELPEPVAKRVLTHWFMAAAAAKDTDMLAVAVKVESDILVNEGHEGYFWALHEVKKNIGHFCIYQPAGYIPANGEEAKKNRDFCVYILENMITEKFQVKPFFDSGSCKLAAQAAAYVGREDLIFLFQDKALSVHEQAIQTHGYSVDDYMLGYKIKTCSDDVIPGLVAYLYMLGKVDSVLIDSDQSDSEVEPLDWDFVNLLSEQKVFNFMVDECVSPALARALISLLWDCKSAFDIDESDEILAPVDEALLASQMNSLVIDGDSNNDLTGIQTSFLEKIGTDYLKQKIGSVDALLMECFGFVDANLALDEKRVYDHLINKFSFPKSLASFLAQSMRETVDKQAALPMPALPPGILMRDVPKLLTERVSTKARQDFIKNFSEILKQQQLITLFNKEAEGRETIWTNYFYAYLDILKEGLSVSDTVQ